MGLSSPGLAGVVLSLLLVSSTVATVAAVETFTIDGDHPLASSSAVDRYDDRGQVSAELAAPAVTIEIAQKHDDVGVDATRSDLPYHYLRIKYDETLPAIIRLHIPAGYWHPQPQNIGSITDDSTAKFRPDSRSRYTIVTVRFDGRSDAVFPVPKTASLVFSTREAGYGVVENRTDVEVPSLGSKSEWHYIDSSRLNGNNATVKILSSEDLLIQYDVSDSAISERWLSVQKCTSSKGQASPVCRFEREGVDEYVFLLLRTEDAPAIRYKEDPGTLETIRSIGDGISVSIDNLLDMVSGLWGGG